MHIHGVLLSLGYGVFVPVKTHIATWFSMWWSWKVGPNGRYLCMRDLLSWRLGAILEVANELPFWWNWKHSHREELVSQILGNKSTVIGWIVKESNFFNFILPASCLAHTAIPFCTHPVPFCFPPWMKALWGHHQLPTSELSWHQNYEPNNPLFLISYPVSDILLQ